MCDEGLLIKVGYSIYRVIDRASMRALLTCQHSLGVNVSTNDEC
ncbi:hypothetical protein X728_28890 [Mesorhizobium sp. L103C120A0]|nr:hypothetical protein X728_28890 [Mesorhizobium sp. L103C120A0]